MPEGTMKALPPRTPACASSISAAALPGTTPAQKPASTASWPWVAAILASKAARDVVTGDALSGMSTMVVTPPAAAARVAVAKPSHSVRPGSLTWTWVSTSPGSSTSSGPTSTTVAVPSCAARSDSYGSMAAIRPSRTPTQRATSPAPVITRRARNTRPKSDTPAPLGSDRRSGGRLRRVPGGGLPAGDEQVQPGAEDRADEPGERREPAEQRHHRGGYQRDHRRDRGRGDERADGLGVPALAVVVLGLLGGAVQVGDVDLTAAAQVVVGDDDSEQRAEEGGEPAEEVLHGDRAAVDLPRHDEQRGDGGDEAAALEV